MTGMQKQGWYMRIRNRRKYVKNIMGVQYNAAGFI
jgi:hypothetical protein